MRPVVRRYRSLARALAWCAVAGAARAGEGLSIVSPEADEILYGPTRVRVEVEGEAARVDVYLDRFPAPICRFTAPPYECGFDAGTRLDSRVLRAEGFGADGRSLGRDAIVTYSFIESERVTASALTVPLVASVDGAGPPDLRGATWRCLYGGEPCEVLGAARLGDNVEGLGGEGVMRGAHDPMVERGPVSLEVLIDVSPSVWAERSEIDDALRRVVDETPTPVEIGIAEFAGTYERLVPFTASKSMLRRGLRGMSRSRPFSCVLEAVRRSLAELHVRPGHKALLVISDAEETCETVREIWRSERDPEGTALEDVGGALDYPDRRPSGMDPWGSAIRARPRAIGRTQEFSRQVGIPIYVYRVGGDSVTSRNAVEALRRMAEESGGRWIQAQDLSGLSQGLGSLLADLESTWLLDIALPTSREREGEEELTLTLDPPRAIELRYPTIWRGGNRDALLVALLRMGGPEARAWSAERLRDSRDRSVLPELLAAYRAESSATGRIEEMTAIYHVSAWLLLHGGEEDQRAALSIIEELRQIDPVLLRRLRPALVTFQKMAAPGHLRAKAGRLAEAAPLLRPLPRAERG